VRAAFWCELIDVIINIPWMGGSDGDKKPPAPKDWLILALAILITVGFFAVLIYLRSKQA
jgi:hypothetical protein